MAEDRIDTIHDDDLTDEALDRGERGKFREGGKLCPDFSSFR